MNIKVLQSKRQGRDESARHKNTLRAYWPSVPDDRTTKRTKIKHKNRRTRRKLRHKRRKRKYQMNIQKFDEKKQ